MFKQNECAGESISGAFVLQIKERNTGIRVALSFSYALNFKYNAIADASA